MRGTFCMTCMRGNFYTGTSISVEIRIYFFSQSSHWSKPDILDRGITWIFRADSALFETHVGNHVGVNVDFKEQESQYTTVLLLPYICRDIKLLQKIFEILL